MLPSRRPYRSFHLGAEHQHAAPMRQACSHYQSGRRELQAALIAPRNRTGPWRIPTAKIVRLAGSHLTARTCPASCPSLARSRHGWIRRRALQRALPSMWRLPCTPAPSWACHCDYWVWVVVHRTKLGLDEPKDMRGGKVISHLCAHPASHKAKSAFVTH